MDEPALRDDVRGGAEITPGTNQLNHRPEFRLVVHKPGLHQWTAVVAAKDVPWPTINTGYEDWRLQPRRGQQLATAHLLLDMREEDGRAWTQAGTVMSPCPNCTSHVESYRDLLSLGSACRRFTEGHGGDCAATDIRENVGGTTFSLRDLGFIMLTHRDERYVQPDTNWDVGFRRRSCRETDTTNRIEVHANPGYERGETPLGVGCVVVGAPELEVGIAAAGSSVRWRGGLAPAAVSDAASVLVSGQNAHRGPRFCQRSWLAAFRGTRLPSRPASTTRPSRGGDYWPAVA